MGYEKREQLQENEAGWSASVQTCHINVGRRQSEQMKWGWRDKGIGYWRWRCSGVKREACLVGHSHAGFRYNRLRAITDDSNLRIRCLTGSWDCSCDKYIVDVAMNVVNYMGIRPALAHHHIQTHMQTDIQQDSPRKGLSSVNGATTRSPLSHPQNYFEYMYTPGLCSRSLYKVPAGRK